MNVALLIRDRRLELGWTQDKLIAELKNNGTGISPSYLSMLENGNSLPSAQMICALSIVLDIDIYKVIEADRADQIDKFEMKWKRDYVTPIERIKKCRLSEAACKELA